MGQAKTPEKEPLNMRIDARLKEDFHVWAIRHKREMTQVVESLLRMLLSGEVTPPAPPTKTRKKGSPAVRGR